MLKLRILVVLVGVVIIYLGLINTQPFLSLGGLALSLVGALLRKSPA